MFGEQLTSWEDAGVHEGGHTKVRQNKQEDDSIIDWHGHRETLREPRAAAAQRREQTNVLSHYKDMCCIS